MSGSNPFVNPSVLQPQGNPLQTYGQVLGIQQQQNLLQLFPQLQQQAQIKTQADQLGLTNAQNASVAAYSRYRLAQPNVSSADILADIGQARAAGLNTSGMEQDFATASQEPGFNPQGWVKQHLLNGASVPDTAALTIGTPTSINQGNQVQPGITGGALSPTPGAFNASGGGVNVGNLSPRELAQPVQIGVDANGAPVMGTQGQFLQRSGADPLGTGRPLPPGLRGPNAAPMGVSTGIGPAQQSASAATGANSANAFQDASNQGVKAQSQNSLLNTMLADTSQFTTGPSGINNLRAWLVRNGQAVGMTFGADPTKVAAQESFDKLANQLADAQGAGSDARLSVNQHANPSSALSPAGVDQIIRQLQGNSDYQIARAKLANAYPNKADIAGFNAQAQALNPQVFQYNRMTPEQKANYYKSLPNKTQFQKDYGVASDAHLIGAQNANQ
jgi:hypothetical protein